MIGGQGEKKTLRMVAQYADESNLTGDVENIPRKLEVLAEHCERLGRDRSEIKVTKLLMIAVAPTMDVRRPTHTDEAIVVRSPWI